VTSGARPNDQPRRTDLDDGRVLFSTDDLRVLRLLPSQMSFGEIAVVVEWDAPQVKTRAIAIYRRLGAVSRAEAVERARSLGLIQ
jgi:LuxR family maltose regulon positive regulatory protein